MKALPFVACAIGDCLAGGILAGCSSAVMGPHTVFADPGKYEYHSCEQLATQRQKWTERELELKMLMDKAEQGTGGAVVNLLAYRGDHLAANEELRVIQAAAAAKKCNR